MRIETTTITCDVCGRSQAQRIAGKDYCRPCFAAELGQPGDPLDNPYRFPSLPWCGLTAPIRYQATAFWSQLSLMFLNDLPPALSQGHVAMLLDLLEAIAANQPVPVHSAHYEPHLHLALDRVQVHDSMMLINLAGTLSAAYALQQQQHQYLAARARWDVPISRTVRRRTKRSQ